VIQPDNSGSLQLATNNGTTAMTIDTSQNVGIGTTSPEGKLDIATGGTTDIVAALGGTFPAYTYRNGTNTWFHAGKHPTNDYFYIGTGATPTTNISMVIDSSGNVLVGCTATPSASVKGTGFITDGTAGTDLYIGVNSTAGDRVVWFYNPNGLVGGIVLSGSATAYNTSSDYRLKENIAPMTGALDKVALLKPVTYKWKVDGSNGEGFIAHELAEVVPQAVTGEKDAVNEDGSIDPQGIDTSFLVATLTAAIQEQQTIINDLKARIETLEAK
jgi:hypothetical protein